ncbi:MAG TPA: hypothetical protein VLK84_18750, partial [Longimicrobium sp.]|nr:hypothetical protein [Longimicrobium sp.]
MIGRSADRACLGQRRPRRGGDAAGGLEARTAPERVPRSLFAIRRAALGQMSSVLVDEGLS